MVAKHFSNPGHDRKQVQELGPFKVMVIKIEAPHEFLRLSDVDKHLLPRGSKTFSSEGFLNTVNAIAKPIRDEHAKGECLAPLYLAFFSPTLNHLLLFKATGSKAHRGHVADTQCKPDYTVASEGHWIGETSDTTLK